MKSLINPKAYPPPRKTNFPCKAILATLAISAFTTGSADARPIFLNNLEVDGNLSVIEDEERLDGVVFYGTFDGSSSIPETGPGTRFMWYPRKAALRAGHVTGTQWDDPGIGDYSIALGHNSVASGESSIAIGPSSSASGISSIALGRHLSNSVYSSLVVGQYNEIIAGSGSTWEPADPLFVIGNGDPSGEPSNALIVRKSGNTELYGMLNVDGNIEAGGRVRAHDRISSEVTDGENLVTIFAANNDGADAEGTGVRVALSNSVSGLETVVQGGTIDAIRQADGSNDLILSSATGSVLNEIIRLRGADRSAVIHGDAEINGDVTMSGEVTIAHVPPQGGIMMGDFGFSD